MRQGTTRPWWLLPAALVLLHVCNPETWVQNPFPTWFPPAGIALALAAWLGWRGLVLVALDTLLVALSTQLIGGWNAPLLGLGLWKAILLPLQAGVTWVLYQAAGGKRRLRDPGSVTLFLILAPGVAAWLFAVLSALPCWLPNQDVVGFWEVAASFWVSNALGILAVTPLLLVFGTPLLVRYRLVARTSPADADLPHAGQLLATGDWVEIGGLVAATGVLALLLAFAPGLWDMPAWQLWGVPLLLIVWASLRRGLAGGVLTAAVVCVLSLSLAALLNWDEQRQLLLDGNLLAQTTTALVVGVCGDWIRASEARYRQVVSNVPAVLYSARVSREETQEGRPPDAEITFVSPACQKLLGCAPEKLHGHYSRWLQCVHPQDQEIVLAALAQLARQNQPVVCEYRLATEDAEGKEAGQGSGRRPAVRPPGPNGSRVIAHHTPVVRERWVRDTLVPHFGPNGELQGWEGVVTDITQQRLLADDLRRTTSMFHALVANLPAGVFFVQNPSGRPILVNARARHLLGQREDPSAGLQHLSQTYRLHRPDGTAYPAEELPVCVALRRCAPTMRDDIVVHRPDGRRLPLVSWAAPVDLAGQGKPDAAVWVLEDLTALHQAESARRESEARLRAVIETMAEGLIVQDETGAIVECNPAACAILGLPAESLQGRSLLGPEWLYFTESGLPLPPTQHPAVIGLRTGQAVRDVVIGLAPTGLHDEPTQRKGTPAKPARVSAVRWLLVNALPLGMDPEEKASRVVITLTDITAQRHAMEVVKASEEKYRGLVETLPLLVILWDRDLRVTYLNPAAITITGYELPDVAEPAAWKDIVHTGDLPKMNEACHRALAGEMTRLEVRYRAKDGSDKVGYFLVQPRWHDGQIVGGTSLVVDITRERRLEDELQRAQRLELVGRLASGIAHDFNNLLTVVLSLTELAKYNLPDDHPVRQDLNRIGDAGEQAANLAGQLLAFSKSRRIQARRVEVNRVARRTLDLLRATLPPRITVQADLDEGELPVLADETQIQQVLMNLCLNARDAMPGSGRLTVKTQAVHAAIPVRINGNGNGHHDAEPSSTLATEAWVLLTVQDDGQGMPQAVKDRIFDPFFSTKERGTGLGLAVVHQIVTSYGGRVEVWSQPGIGSRFSVWLPRTNAEAIG